MITEHNILKHGFSINYSCIIDVWFANLSEVLRCTRMSMTKITHRQRDLILCIHWCFFSSTKVFLLSKTWEIIFNTVTNSWGYSIFEFQTLKNFNVWIFFIGHALKSRSFWRMRLSFQGESSIIIHGSSKLCHDHGMILGMKSHEPWMNHGWIMDHYLWIVNLGNTLFKLLPFPNPLNSRCCLRTARINENKQLSHVLHDRGHRSLKKALEQLTSSGAVPTNEPNSLESSNKDLASSKKVAFVNAGHILW